jgi:multiple sugar transport system substrate-binding protein/raffinose/stachyose/melibiose transport system substrate-binding protein
MHPEMPVDQSIINQKISTGALWHLTPTAPDVLDWFAGNRARFFIDKGLILTADTWAANKFDDVYAPGRPPATMASISYQHLITGGQSTTASRCSSGGIAKAPETFDELLDACDKLNTAGIAPFTIGARFKWPAAAWFDYLNMRTNGPQFHIDLTDLKVPYTDPKVKATFDNWKKLLDHKSLSKTRQRPASYRPDGTGPGSHVPDGRHCRFYPDEAEGT